MNDVTVSYRTVRPQFHEEQEQQRVIDWAALQLPAWGLPRDCLFAIPNGAHLAGDREQRARQMIRLKRVGLLPGAADLLLTVPRGGRAGLWVEMKKPREKFASPAAADRAWTPEQRRFAETQRKLGYAYAICYGFEEAHAAIVAYVRGKLEGQS